MSLRLEKPRNNASILTRCFIQIIKYTNIHTAPLRLSVSVITDYLIYLSYTRVILLYAIGPNTRGLNRTYPYCHKVINHILIKKMGIRTHTALRMFTGH